MSCEFEVKVRHEPALAYESVVKEVSTSEIDEFVRTGIARLRERHQANGRPFAIYMGCDKEDAQLVEVCLPIDGGSKELPAAEVAYTVARGHQCDYPEILSAYDAVTRYVTDAGRSFAGPPREIYLTDLETTRELEMQIAFPLAD